jgi:hypothetical protein
MAEIWRFNATKRGEELAREQEVTSLPVKPMEIAENLGILVEPLPSDRKGVSGMLLQSGGSFGILYASYLENEGFENFCIAHELGHYHMPGHPQHESKAGFVSHEQFEHEADHFAAGLLMPAYLFDRELNRHVSGLAAVEALREQCGTSLTATAIRYAQRSPDAVAIIVSQGNSVNYCFMSDELAQVRGVSWVRKNSQLPAGSVTDRFNQNPDNVLTAQRAQGDASFSDWFGPDHDIELFEEVVGLGSYGYTLTVLSADNIPDEEELDDEGTLKESWGAKFRR